ncbi:hypothetical protein SAMN05878482_11060 [Peribacillus simplex]|uniref:Uncharacterized protein n=1 Tax=Peribacillus simplex TaxID=1478 RepID=A0A9X8RDW6_9BACI|nr:hypothetical protein SAMN05878482_11060 [Peribacillus simplex]
MIQLNGRYRLVLIGVKDEMGRFDKVEGDGSINKEHSIYVNKFDEGSDTRNTKGPSSGTKT